MSNSVIIPLNYIERKPNSDYYRVVGKGVTVEFLSRLIVDPEWDVERICENYELTPAEVYAAWSFYYDHKEEIDRRVEEAARQFDSHADADMAKRDKLLRNLVNKNS